MTNKKIIEKKDIVSGFFLIRDGTDGTREYFGATITGNTFKRIMKKTNTTLYYLPMLISATVVISMMLLLIKVN